MQRIGRLVVSSAIAGLVLAGCNKPESKSSMTWGYIDKTGNFIIKPQFDEASNFNPDGAAFVRDGKRILRLKAKPPGESTDPVKPEDVPTLAPGVTLRAAEGKDDTYKIMDGEKCVFDPAKGVGVVASPKPAPGEKKEVVPAADGAKGAVEAEVKYPTAEELSQVAAADPIFKGNDYVCVFFGKKCAFLDRQGKLFLAPFDQARNFSGNRAAVQDGHKWGFINRKGRFVIPPKYVGAGDFVNGLAPVAVPADSK